MTHPLAREINCGAISRAGADLNSTADKSHIAPAGSPEAQPPDNWREERSIVRHKSWTHPLLTSSRML